MYLRQIIRNSCPDIYFHLLISVDDTITQAIQFMPRDIGMGITELGIQLIDLFANLDKLQADSIEVFQISKE